MGCQSSRSIETATAPTTKIAAGCFASVTKITIKPDQAAAAATTLASKVPTFLKWEGVVGVHDVKVSDTEMWFVGLYKDEAALLANADNVKAAMMDFAPFFAVPPDRVTGEIAAVATGTGAPITAPGAAAAVTKIALQPGKYAEAKALLDAKLAAFEQWEGLVNFAAVKVSDELLTTIAVYKDAASLKANADNVKAALGELGPMLAGAPGRAIGTVTLNGDGSTYTPPAPLMDVLMTAQVASFADWLPCFQEHATSTTFHYKGKAHTVSMPRGACVDVAKEEVFTDIADPNAILVPFVDVDMAKMGALMSEDAFVHGIKEAVVSQTPPSVMLEMPAPGGAPPSGPVDMFFSYEVADADKWVEGFLAHAHSKTGTWGVEAAYARSEFCDEARTRVFRSATNPKRVGGLVYDVDMAKMGAFMADPSFAKISEVLAVKPETMFMKLLAPMPPPPAAPPKPYTLLTIQPTFTVKDWAKAKPIMAEFVEATKTEAGCIYYGWSTRDDKLFCREGYSDAAAALAHLDNVGALVGKLLESAATLDGIELHGPSAELEKCKSAMDGFGTTYWEVDGGISFMSQEVGAERAAQSLMSIQPTFTVKDWAKAKPIMEEFVEATKKETGCVFYGWTKSGDKLFCREAYVDAAGALAHLDNVGALVGKLLESAATLDKIELHGLSAELEKCKSAMDGFGTTYWAIDSGFQNYAI